jgi:hypothetical protein
MIDILLKQLLKQLLKIDIHKTNVISELYVKWHSSCEYLVLTVVLAIVLTIDLTFGFNICFSNISTIKQHYNNIL